MFTIYQVTNTINGKFYIGFTSVKDPRQRWRQHRFCAKHGSDSHFYRAIRKYGMENFKFSVIEEGSDTKVGRDIREPYWISVLKPEYNTTAGGEGSPGYKHTDKWKKEQRERKLGKKYQTGYNHTTEQRQSQSLRSKGISQRRVVCPNCGKVGGVSNMKRRHFGNCLLRPMPFQFTIYPPVFDPFIPLHDTNLPDQPINRPADLLS